MNIAIVIGVSKYTKFQNLSSCKHDANIMYEILEKSCKYDDILFIEDNTVSGFIMNQLDSFINKYIHRKINEVFFYFSGHGLTKEDEFYYCTTNTIEDRINTTSLCNKNIDQLIRTLNPKLFVKIVDACESGTAYIKGTSKVGEILNKEKDGFKNCYFFSSSQSDQNSYARKKIGEFTFQFLTIIYARFEKGLEIIKYRDLSDELSDAFIDEKQQPFFVLQGGLSETFLEKNDKLVKHLTLKLKELSDETDEYNDSSLTLEDISEEKAIQFKEKNIIAIENKLKKVPILLKKYSYTLDQIMLFDSVIPREKICKWLIENKDKYFVFAKTKETRVLKTRENNYMSLFQPRDYDYVTNDYEVTVDNDNNEVAFEYSSTNIAFPKMLCHVVFIYSLTKLFIFYGFASSIPDSWDSYESYKLDSVIKYKVVKYSDNYKNIIDPKLKEIADEFKKYSENYINSLIENVLN